MVRAAIAGCGAICRMHAGSLEQAGATLVGAADLNIDRAQALVDEFGGKAFDSLDAMLCEAKPDVLHICTPHYLHIPMAITALERNINVLTEKPLALSADDAARLQPVLQTTKAQFGVCYQNRFIDPVVQAKKVIAEGKLGRLKSIRGIVTWWRDEPYYTQSGWRGAWSTEGGGVMINQAVHTLDLLMHFAGTPEAVGATVANHHLKGIIEVEDSAEMFFRFPEGVTGVMYATTAFGGDAPVLIDLFFDNGSLRIEGDHLTVSYQHTAGQAVAPEIYQGKCCWGPGHASLISEFYDCLRTGRAFSVDYSQAQRVCRILDTVYRSNQIGEVIVF